MARSLLVGCLTVLGLGLSAPAGAEEPLTFRTVVELGRRAAPDVRLEEADVAVARGELVGARLWTHENPSLELGAGRRWGQETTLDREVTLAVPLELGSKRARRIALARAVIDRETHETTDARRVTGGAAAGAYFQVLYAQRLMALAEDRRSLADSLVTTARDRLASGDVAEFEVNLASGELARAESAIAAARGQLSRTLTRLAIELGLPSPEGLEVAGELSDRSFVGDAAAGTRADILAARADLEATDAAVALADSLRWPELSLRVTYAHEEQADIVFGSVAFTLPVFDRNQGERAAARARRRRAAIALEATRDIASAQLEGARATYRAALEALASMEETAIPLAIDNERLAREAYAAGKIDLTALLVVRREALEAREEHLDRLLQAALAGVDLWVAAGAELPDPLNHWRLDMTTKITWTLALTLALALGAGCSKDEGAEPATKEAAGEQAPTKAAEPAHGDEGGHAAAGVVPGSHEDWCGEHGVAESQCTRCNPELAAAFKATGDWCEEHGLPESQCTRCNPDLEIVRPPPAGGEAE